MPPIVCGCNNFPASLGNVFFGANVGIGAEPGHKLHVAGVNPDVALENTTSGQKFSLVSVAASGPNPAPGFGVREDAAGLYRLYATNTGLVGMGTVNPQNSLHVAAPGATGPSIGLENTTTGMRFSFVNYGTTAAWRGLGLYDHATGAGYRWFVGPAGEMGIGTPPSPANRLVVLDKGNDQAGIVLSSLANGARGLLEFRKPAAMTWQVGSSNDRDGLAAPLNRLMFLNSAGVEAMTLMQEGRLGIGRMNPAFPLHVEGTIRTEESIEAAAQVRAVGVVSTGDIWADGTVRGSSVVSAGTISGPRVEGTTVVGGTVAAGSLAVDAGVTAQSLEASGQVKAVGVLSTGDIWADGTVRGSSVVSAGTISAPTIQGTTVVGGTVAGESVAADTGVTAQTVTATNSIGIGRPAPTTRLEIGSNVEQPLVRFVRTDGTHSAAIGATAGPTTGGTGKALIFYTNDQPRVRINEVGNVGIGTPSIEATLHVEGGEILSRGNPQEGKGRVSAREFFRVTSAGGRDRVVDSEGKVYGAVYG